MKKKNGDELFKLSTYILVIGARSACEKHTDIDWRES